MSARDALARLSPQARAVWEQWHEALLREGRDELRHMKFGMLLGFACGLHEAGEIDALAEAELLMLAEVSLSGVRIVELEPERARRGPIGGTDGHA